MKVFFLAILLSFFLGFSVVAQNSTGIVFSRYKDWDEVLKTAKSQKKYIFIDAYTTWCIPCKVMESEVFSRKEVGDLFNSKFINVKLQFDNTENDDEHTISWRNMVQKFEEDYNINSYPTYLFFNAEGELSHRQGGGTSASEFIAKALIVLESSPEYFRLKSKYDLGDRSPEVLYGLIKSMEKLENKESLPFLVNEYLKTQTDLLEKENLRLLITYTKNSNDVGFGYLNTNSQNVDNLSMKGTSSKILSDITVNEKMIAFLRNGGTRTIYGGGMEVYSGEVRNSVNWDSLKTSLIEQYPVFGERVFLEAKLLYASWTDNFEDLVEALDRSIEIYGSSIESGKLHRYAYFSFNKSDDKDILQAALKWSDNSIKSANDNDKLMYVYLNANIRYKLGKKEDAIELVNAAVRELEKEDRGKMKDGFTDLLKKINQSEPTW